MTEETYGPLATCCGDIKTWEEFTRGRKYIFNGVFTGEVVTLNKVDMDPQEIRDYLTKELKSFKTTLGVTPRDKKWILKNVNSRRYKHFTRAKDYKVPNPRTKEQLRADNKNTYERKKMKKVQCEIAFEEMISHDDPDPFKRKINQTNDDYELHEVFSRESWKHFQKTGEFLDDIYGLDWENHRVYLRSGLKLRIMGKMMVVRYLPLKGKTKTTKTSTKKQERRKNQGILFQQWKQSVFRGKHNGKFEKKDLVLPPDPPDPPWDDSYLGFI